MALCAAVLSACGSPAPSAEKAPAPTAIADATPARESTAAQSPEPQSNTGAGAAEPAARADGWPTESVAPARKGNGNRIRFLPDSTEIDEQDMKLLLANANRLKGDPRLVVTLVAHTENAGSRSYNLAVAEEEIDAVRTLLRSFGVPARQIRHRSPGRRKSSANCAPQACRQEMRHVDLLYE